MEVCIKNPEKLKLMHVYQNYEVPNAFTIESKFRYLKKSAHSDSGRFESEQMSEAYFNRAFDFDIKHSKRAPRIQFK